MRAYDEAFAAEKKKGAAGASGGGFDMSSLTNMFGGGGGNAAPTVPAGCEDAARAGKDSAQKSNQSAAQEAARQKAQQQAQQQAQQAAQQAAAQQRPPVPPLVCSGFKADKETVEPGKQVTIKFAIPNATAYELRGGAGSVSAQGAVVKPTESTTYYIVGTNAQMVAQAQQQGAQAQQGQQNQSGQYLDGSQYAYQPGSFGQTGAGGTGTAGQQQGTPGQGTCGPITINVETKKIVAPTQGDEKNLDSLLGASSAIAFKNLKPTLKCPVTVVRGKAANILWSCPDDTANPDAKVRSVSASVAEDGSALADVEKLQTNGIQDGAKRVYPDSSVEYGLVCKNEKSVRTKVAKCFVEVIEPGRSSSRAVRAGETSAARVSTMAQKPVAVQKKNVTIDARPKVISVSKKEQVTVKWSAPASYDCVVHGPSGYVNMQQSGSVTGGSDEPGMLDFDIMCNEGADNEAKERVSVSAVE
jgi:hypothetical protein